MHKVTREGLGNETRVLPEELPVSITIGGTSHAVMMLSPFDLDDFAYGFLRSEGIIENAQDIDSITQLETTLGIDLQIELKRNLKQTYQAARRNALGPVGCGLCGAENIDAAFANLPQVTPTKLPQDFPWQALTSLQNEQAKRNAHGALHAAAAFDTQGNLICTREDIGRHNALDKVIGHLLKNKVQASSLLVTSRVSVDLVIKALRAGIGGLMGRATPSQLALELAQKHDLNLIAPIFEDAYFISKDPT